MKALLWLALLMGITLCVTFPSYYFYTASGLPKLDTEFDLEELMRLTVEGERMSLKMGLYNHDKGGVAFERPDFSRLPKDFVAMYITMVGCPTYFQTPREEGGKWSWRIYGGNFLGVRPAGDGRCERVLALMIAEEVGVHAGFERAIAASRIHAFLQKDQLVAYVLAGMYFDRAVMGPDAAARELFGKPLDQFQLSELAEFTLALPDMGYYDDLKACKNPALLRQGRDNILDTLAADGLVTKERAESARGQPLACTRRP